MTVPKGAFGYCAVCYHPLDRCSHCDQPSGDRQMPEILAGDVVDLDGFQLRPVFPKSIRALQGNDGVKAIYRIIWKRPDRT